MINIKDFDPSLLKIDKKSYKNINTYCIGYITIKDSEYVKLVKEMDLLNSVPLKKKMETNT